jgi:hypothetical protein
MTTRELLIRAQDLLKKGWVNGGPARSSYGRTVDARSIEACSWSVFGALAAVEAPFSKAWEDAMYRLMKESGEPSPVAFLDWSESMARKPEEILDIFDRALKTAP